MTSLGRPAIPAERLRDISDDALTVVIQQPETILGLDVAGLGSEPQCRQRLRQCGSVDHGRPRAKHSVSISPMVKILICGRTHAQGRRPELRRELVDRAHSGDREDRADRANHALVNRDVALDPLRAHDEAWAQLARIAQPIAGAHARALRHGVDGDEGRVGVRVSGDDTDRTAVQARIGRLLARGEETVGVEVEPRSWTRHEFALDEEDPSYCMGSRESDPRDGVSTDRGSAREAHPGDCLYWCCEILGRGRQCMKTVQERVKNIVAAHIGVKSEQISADSTFVDELGADSLDMVELMMALEDEFGCDIPDVEAEKITTVQQATDYIETHAD